LFILSVFLIVSVFGIAYVEILQTQITGSALTAFSLPLQLISALPFILDTSALIFSTVVLFIGLFTQVYSLAYLRFDRRIFSFTALLLLFVLSMLCLV
jgi:NADH:ubiquinone oxidoreductase subunit 5 (subunit L)/multisubunit Na+/H+ antiporter MnhA subunit